MRTSLQVRNRTTRYTLPLVVFALALAGCGGSDDSSGEPAPIATNQSADPSAAAATASVPGGAPASTEGASAPSTTVTPVDILTDFGDVCRGIRLAGATPYDPTRPGIHPIQTKAGVAPEYDNGGVLLPDQWDPVIGEEQTVELVVCMDRTAATLRETCTGYLDDDGTDTGNAVELYDASYDIRLLSAVDATEIARTQLDASAEVCPSLFFFDGETKVESSYAEPTDALAAWLVTYVET